jgi:hemolysin D
VANRIELKDHSTQAQKNNLSAGAQRTRNLVFPVTLVPDTQVMSGDGAEIALSPGMAVSVEI